MQTLIHHPKLNTYHIVDSLDDFLFQEGYRVVYQDRIIPTEILQLYPLSLLEKEESLHHNLKQRVFPQGETVFAQIANGSFGTDHINKRIANELHRRHTTR